MKQTLYATSEHNGDKLNLISGRNTFLNLRLFPLTFSFDKHTPGLMFPGRCPKPAHRPLQVKNQWPNRLRH
jgi:hypothetical protein